MNQYPGKSELGWREVAVSEPVVMRGLDAGSRLWTLCCDWDVGMACWMQEVRELRAWVLDGSVCINVDMRCGSLSGRKSNRSE